MRNALCLAALALAACDAAAPPTASLAPSNPGSASLSAAMDTQPKPFDFPLGKGDTSRAEYAVRWVGATPYLVMEVEVREHPLSRRDPRRGTALLRVPLSGTEPEPGVYQTEGALGGRAQIISQTARGATGFRMDASRARVRIDAVGIGRVEGRYRMEARTGDGALAWVDGEFDASERHTEPAR